MGSMITYPTSVLATQLGALSLTPGRAPTHKVIVMVCVSEDADCDRHLYLVWDGGSTQQEGCSVHPVWYWRCSERSEGVPTADFLRPEEVSSRFSTLLSRLQKEFGAGISYPAEYIVTEEAF
jgi:hypothetical protein